MKNNSLNITFVCGLLGLLGCQGVEQDVYREDLVTEYGEPAYVTVQHCLIGFLGSVDGAFRKEDAAEALALDLFERAKAGEDFDAIVNEYTEDTPPRPYRIANRGFEADTENLNTSKVIFGRDRLAKAFADTAFSLEVGEFGLAAYDPDDSPYGWHIIKRIR